MFWDNDAVLPEDDPRLRAPLDAVRRAVDEIRQEIRDGEVSEEEPIVQRLANAIKQNIKTLPDSAGTRWNARVVTPKKHTEKDNGTDVAIWVDIDLADDRRGPSHRARKTLLVQAKREDKLPAEMSKLREQVGKMKEFSESAAVLVVGGDRMWTADAETVTLDATARRLADSRRTVPDLFGALFRCQVGDRRWESAQELRDTLEGTPLLLIDGHQRGRARTTRAFT